MARIGQTRMQAPHPVQSSSRTTYPFGVATIAPTGQARRAGQAGDRSQRG